MGDKSRKKYAAKTGQKKSKNAESAHTRGKIITIELVAFMFLAVYLIGYTVSMLNKPKIGIETVDAGQIDVPKQYSGIILREESVTFSEEEGMVVFSYGENEYVKAGAVVCAVRKDGGGEIESQIEAINDSLLSRQALREDNPAQAEEIRRVSSKIEKDVDNAIPLFMQDIGAEVYHFRNQLQKDVDTRNGIILSDADSVFSELVDRRTVFEQQLASGTGTYQADRGGVLSYGVDGLENKLTPDDLMNVTLEQVEQSDSRAPASERNVKAGSPLFKIVSSNTWYLCAYLDNEVVLDWTAGSNKLIYFGDGSAIASLSMRLEAIEPKDGKTYVVFSSSRYLLDFINNRGIEFSLEDDTYKGLKIPNTSITNKTALMLPEDYIYEFRGSSGVYINENGEFSFKRVNLLSKSDGTAYILQDFESVPLGASVYKYEDGKGITESAFVIEGIKTVLGVYVANSGTADFKQISVIMKNDYYTIIENSPTAGVKLYDRIVTDSSTVNNNQIIR